MTETQRYDVSIVGGGPAGCAAALFCGRAGLETVLVANGRSTLQKCAYVENYLDFPAGIEPRTLLTLARGHVEQSVYGRRWDRRDRHRGERVVPARTRRYCSDKGSGGDGSTETTSEAPSRSTALTRCLRKISDFRDDERRLAEPSFEPRSSDFVLRFSRAAEPRERPEGPPVPRC